MLSSFKLFFINIYWKEGITSEACAITNSTAKQNDKKHTIQDLRPSFSVGSPT